MENVKGMFKVRVKTATMNVRGDANPSGPAEGNERQPTKRSSDAESKDPGEEYLLSIGRDMAGDIKVVRDKPKPVCCPTAGGHDTPKMRIRATDSAIQRIASQLVLPSPPTCQVYRSIVTRQGAGGEHWDHAMMCLLLSGMDGVGQTTSTIDLVVDDIGIEVKPWELPYKTDGKQYQATTQQLLSASVLVCYRTLRVFCIGTNESVLLLNKVERYLSKLISMIPAMDLVRFREVPPLGVTWDRHNSHLKTPMMYVDELVGVKVFEEFLLKKAETKIMFIDDNGVQNKPMQLTGDLVSQVACMSTGMPVNDDQLRHLTHPREFILSQAPKDKVFCRTAEAIKIRCKVVSPEGIEKRQMYSQCFGEIDGGVMFLSSELDGVFKDLASTPNNKKPFHEIAKSGVGKLANIVMGFLYKRQAMGLKTGNYLARVYAVLSIPNILTSMYALKVDGLASILKTTASSSPIAVLALLLPPKIRSVDLINAARSEPNTLEALEPTQTPFDFDPVKYDTGRFYTDLKLTGQTEWTRRAYIPGPELVWKCKNIPSVKTTWFRETNAQRRVPATEIVPYDEKGCKRYEEARLWAMTPPKISHAETIDLASERAVPEDTNPLTGLGRSTFFGSPRPLWLSEEKEFIKHGRVAAPTIPWPVDDDTKVRYMECTYRARARDGDFVKENDSIDNIIMSMLMMTKGASSHRSSGTNPASHFEYPQDIRPSYTRGRDLTQLDAPAWVEDESDESRLAHSQALFSKTESSCLALLSGMLTSQYAIRSNGKPGNIYTDDDDFRWGPMTVGCLRESMAVYQMNDGLVWGETSMTMMRRTTQLNMLMSKCIISMESRAAHSTGMGCYAAGDNWAVIRLPNPGAMELPGGHSKYLPKTRYVWFFSDDDEMRTRAPQGFKRLVMRYKQGFRASNAPMTHFSVLYKVADYTEVDMASIISSPIRNYTVTSLFLNNTSLIYNNSRTEVGFMHACMMADVLGAGLVTESRMGQYIADCLQFAARFSGGSSNLWDTAKSVYNDFASNPFSSACIPYIMAMQDMYEVSTQVKSLCMKLKMYSGSAKEKNDRSMLLGVGEEYQKRLYHGLAHNDKGNWNITQVIRTIMNSANEFRKLLRRPSFAQ